MTAELIGHFEHESPEWHAARATGIGGSEIAAILGLSRYQSRYSLWLFKKGLIAPQTVNDQMTVGQYVEPAIVAWLADKHGQWIETKLGTWRSVERPWQVANLDGRMGSDLIECKFQIYEHEWGRDGSDEIPPYYLAQVRWYLDVFGLDTARLGVLFGGSGRFAEFVIHPDDADTALMREAGAEFMASLERNERPDIDAHGATYEAIRAEHDGIDSDLTVELDDETYDEYIEAAYGFDVAKHRLTGAKSALLDEMGDARIATSRGVEVLRRQPTGKGSIALYPIKPKEKIA